MSDALPQSLPGPLEEPVYRIRQSQKPAQLDAPSRLDAWLSRRRAFVALALWLSLMVVYQLDDSLIEEGDAVANVEVPVTLLRTGKLHFMPRLSPIVFLWKSKPPLEEREDYYVRNWHELHEGEPAGYWYATGHLLLNGPRYFVVESPTRDAYVCTFGVIPGLTMLPLAALFQAIHPNFLRSEWLKLSAAKLHASTLVALSAVLLFLVGLRYVRARYALVVALAYALGTCVWAVSSETLWQQTVNLALLCGVIYAFVRVAEDNSRAARIVCGLLIGAAFASRPTALFFALAIGVYLLRRRPDALLAMIASAAPIPLLVACYNQYYFGSPMNFAQELVGHHIALQKTGSERVWQTPFAVGLIGLLASPSRGVLVFSPFLMAAGAGVRRIWSDPRFATLRPLTLAAGATMLMQAKWFDWWGGWTYGYRPWLEAIPVVALCLLPVMESVFARWWTTALFTLALAWSGFVQGLGAFAYDKHWNARDLHRVDAQEVHAFFITEPEARKYAAQVHGKYAGLFACNIDLPMCRYRLWSLEDNIIGYYLHERFQIARENRTHAGWAHLLAPE
jgi:hypothetical protein